MRRVFLMCLAAVLLAAGVVQAVDTWFDDLTGDHLWSTPGNWNTGNLPTLVDWGKIRVGEAIVDSGTNAESLKITIGHSGATTTTLTVDGGTLTMTEDLVPARDGDAIFNVISGTVNIGRDLDVGYTSGNLATVNMTGGTMNVARDLGLPQPGRAGALAIVNMAGGTMNVGDDLDMNENTGDLGNKLNLTGGTIIVNDDLEMIAGGSTMDITFGTLIIGDAGATSVANIQGYIDNGYITGFGIAGNVKMVVADGDITLTALNDPLNRYPAMDAYVYTDPALELSWDNVESLEPNVVNGDVWVDVWFGTDATWIPEPNELLPGYPGAYVDFDKVVDAGLNTTTKEVDASIAAQDYYWRVDTYRWGEPNDSLGIDVGPLMHFTAVDDFPVASVVIDTPSMVTWINEPIHLSATITDDNISAPTIVWTSDEPNAVFTNQAYTYPTATADVTVDWHAAQFNVTVTVSDDSLAGGSVSDSVQHDCAQSACQVADVLGIVADHPADVDGNCVINILDLQRLALDWITDYTLTAPTAIP